MSVTIDPAEQLEFHGPFTRISKESLHVKNPGTEPIIFKVKTTAPKQYCVRPNAGRIEPNSEIEVQIILQPFKENLPQDYKCKDKFLVQTAPIHESFEQQDVTSMWTHVEGQERETMRQHKIKCVFVVPSKEEDILVSPIPEPVTTADIASSSLNTSAPIDTTPVPVQVPQAVNDAPETKAATTRSVAPTISQDTTVNKDPVFTTVPSPVVKDTVADVLPKTTSEDSSDKAELLLALEKIKSLEQQLAEAQKESVRSRSNGRKLAPTVQPLDAVHQHLAALEKPRPIEGYPPQVVFAVAALVFIFTYLFF